MFFMLERVEGKGEIKKKIFTNVLFKMQPGTGHRAELPGSLNLVCDNCLNKYAQMK